MTKNILIWLLLITSFSCSQITEVEPTISTKTDPVQAAPVQAAVNAAPVQAAGIQEEPLKQDEIRAIVRSLRVDEIKDFAHDYPDPQTISLLLIEAVIQHRTYLIPGILALKPNIALTDAKGKTALDHAILDQDVPVIKAILGLKEHFEDHFNKAAYVNLAMHSRDKRDEILALLFAAGASVNQRDHQGNSPLDIAVDKKDLEMVNLIINKGGKRANTNKFRIISELFKSDENLPIVKRLIQADDWRDLFTDPNSCVYQQVASYKAMETLKTLIEVKAPFGNHGCLFRLLNKENGAEVLKLILPTGVDPDPLDEYGRTPLMLVKNLETAKLLVKAGANVNARNRSGTVLTHILDGRFADRDKIYNYLVEAGANPREIRAQLQERADLAVAGEELPDKVIRGEIALSTEVKYVIEAKLRDALETKNPKPISKLLKASASDSHISNIARAGLEREIWNENEEMALALIKAGVDTTPTNSRDCLTLAIDHKLLNLIAPLLKNREMVNPLCVKNSPMHQAVKEGLHEVVKQLLAHNYRIDQSCTTNHAVLATAVEDKKFAIAKTLRKHGLDVNTPCRHYRTPIFHATKHGDQEMVQWLLREGADINPDVTGGNCLMNAIQSRNEQVVQLMLEAGADPHKAAGRKSSPLLEAASWECGVELLIKFGAKPTEGEARDALYYSAGRQNLAHVTALLDAGADPNYKGSGNRTALHNAVRVEDNANVIKALIKAGADPHAKNAIGKSPVSIARDYNPDYLPLLVQKKI